MRSALDGDGQRSTRGLHDPADHVFIGEAALARGLAVEPTIMPANKADYERQRKRGIQIFGSTRQSEYNLLKAAALRAMEPYK